VRNESVVVEEEVTGSRYWQGFMLDITEAKKAEEALKKSEERYRLVARATDETIWDSDILADEQTWNGAIETMFGYPLELRTSTAWWEEHIHPGDRERILGTSIPFSKAVGRCGRRSTASGAPTARTRASSTALTWCATRGAGLRA
jgi:PAS domain-containing protein